LLSSHASWARGARTASSTVKKTEVFVFRRPPGSRCETIAARPREGCYPHAPMRGRDSRPEPL